MDNLNQNEPGQDSWMGHLIELRQRILHAGSAVLILFIVLLPWQSEIYHWLAQPLLSALPKGALMIATDVTAPFFVPLKAVAMIAFIIALPYVLYQAWAFIAPGLYARERSLILPLVTSSYVLFLVGMAFAYFIVFPSVFAFVSKLTPQGVAMMTDIEKYLSFAIATFIAFGITFEVPVLVVVLVYLKWVSIETLTAWRRYIIVIAFIVAAVFTPPDVLSQLLMAIPLWVLYEVGLLIARFSLKRKKTVASSADE